MTAQRRWMKSAITASTEISVKLPWARPTRSRPLAVKPQIVPKPQALAAR